ncbi:MAG TPA: hypothetical protein VEU51_00985 [Candidatus Acidoferrales bacterium]|nr:hypothetical protein [Candidatus Acidoferrales bacterium]
MAETKGAAVAVSVAERTHEHRGSDRTRLAHGHSIAKPLGPVMGEELVNEIEQKPGRGDASGAQGAEKWRALDQLLRTSFAMVSPAYLFNSFPENP